MGACCGIGADCIVREWQSLGENKMLFQILELIASFVESFFVFWVYAKVCGKDFQGKKSAITAIILTGVVLLCNQITLFSVITSLMGVFLIAAGLFVVYRGGYADCVAITGVYMMVLYISDFFTISFLGWVFGVADYAGAVLQEASWQRALLLIIAKSFMVLVCYILANIFRKIYFNKKEVSIFLPGGIVILYFVVQRTYTQTSEGIFMMWVYLLLVISFMIYAIMLHRANAAEKERLLLESEVLYMTEQNAKMYAKNLEENRTFYHDLKNQFILVKEYLETGQYQKAIAYLEELHIPTMIERNEKITGIESLDILLNYKRFVAKQDDINMFIVSDFVTFPIPEYELTALFGNLLDNAIEACRKVKNGSIELTIRKVNRMNLIKIVNSYGELKVQDGRIISEKSQPGEHGVGLSSIRTIVEKHGGSCEIEYDGEVFSVCIIL